MGQNNYHIDLSDRFKAAFGSDFNAAKYVPENVVKLPGAAVNNTLNNAKYLPGEIIQNAQAKSKKPSSKNYSGSGKDIDQNKITTSIIGTPFFDVVQFPELLDSQGNVYAFPNDPLIDLFHSKNIVETPIQGGEAVVEMISTNAVGLRIRGILWNGNGVYPEDQVRDLLNIFHKDNILEVNSRILEMNGIKSMVIASCELVAIEGYEDTQPFMIEARSHKPVELLILEQ